MHNTSILKQTVSLFTFVIYCTSWLYCLGVCIRLHVPEVHFVCCGPLPLQYLDEFKLIPSSQNSCSISRFYWFGQDNRLYMVECSYNTHSDTLRFKQVGKPSFAKWLKSTNYLGTLYTCVDDIQAL